MSDILPRRRVWLQGWEAGACGFPAVRIHNAKEHDGLYDAGHAEGLKARAAAQKQAEFVDAPTPQPREKPSRRTQQSLFGDAPRAKGAVSVFVQYREAFATGVGEALKREFVAPSIKGPDDPLVRALGVFAVKNGAKLGGAELLTWIRTMAAKWISDSEFEPELEWPYQSFVKWLNRGRHRASEKSAQELQRPRELERQDLSSTPIASRRAARR